MIRVYTASKLHHAPMWRSLCASRKDVIFHARWLKQVTMGTPDVPEEAEEFWTQDEEDIASSDGLIVYRADGDVLRGALVEVGMALAKDIPVVTVGELDGTWMHHPGVIARVSTIDEAIKVLRSVAMGEM